MLILHMDEDDKTYLAVAFPPIHDMNAVKDLRDALFEVMEICVSYQEAKDVSNPYHLYLLSCLIKELTKDLEHKEEGGGQ